MRRRTDRSRCGPPRAPYGSTSDRIIAPDATRSAGTREPTQRTSVSTAAPGVDRRRPPSRCPRASEGARPATSSAAAALSSTTSRRGPVSPAQDRHGDRRRASARRRRGGRRPRPREPEARGVETPAELAVADVVHHGEAGRRELVQAVQPRNSFARAPRRASTCAISGSMRSSETPTTCANGRAGLVSGPRKLNTVGTRSSRRTGPA